MKLYVQGGWIHVAYDYILSNNGIMTSDNYPFEGVDGKCRYNESMALSLSDIRLSSYVQLPASDDNKLCDALFTIGPIAVAMNSELESFLSYSSGIYYDPECDKDTEVNHAVLLVG